MTRHRKSGGFTLLELLVVVGLIAALSFALIGGLGGGGKSAALQSAQATMANLITAARTKALASGQPSRVMVQVDVINPGQPLRYLHYVAVQAQTSSGWQTVADVYLPDGIFVVPGNFSPIPPGLFAMGTSTPWTKTDGSALRSTALRTAQITSETVNSSVAEQWVWIQFSFTGGTQQSQDIILAAGRVRPLGSYQPGESPVELDNPENVRGLTLSSYGLPTLVNSRSSF